MTSVSSATASAACPVGSECLLPRSGGKRLRGGKEKKEKHTLGIGEAGKALDGSGEEWERPKPPHHGGQEQSEEQEFTGAEEQGSL